MDEETKQKVREILRSLDRFAEATPINRQWHAAWQQVYGKAADALHNIGKEECQN